MSATFCFHDRTRGVFIARRHLEHGLREETIGGVKTVFYVPFVVCTVAMSE